MYNFLSTRIKQYDGLDSLKRVLRVYFEYDTIFLVTLIDSIIILFAF